MKFILTLCLIVASAPAFAQSMAESVMVQPVGTYDGPLQKTASPVLVELFSSQNCPACPPADEYMEQLSESKGVIALSCHVDYFGKTSANLGKKFCTKRQTKYVEQLGRKSHFTPQMMINGHMSEIGYEASNVAAAIVKGRAERVQEIQINAKATNVFDFAIQKSLSPVNAKLWVAVYQKPKTFTERGQPVTYYNVVKHFIPLGNWNGGSYKSGVSPLIDAQSAGFAIVAQDITNGKILAAGNYKL